MSLRLRTILTLAIILGLALGALFLIAQLILIQSYIQLDNDRALQNVQRVVNTMQNEIDDLASTTSDWARWDDAYAFVQGTDPAFVEGEIPSVDIPIAINLNLMLFADLKGNLLFGRAADLANAAELDLPTDAINVLLQQPAAQRPEDDIEIIRGVLMVGDTPAYVAFAPVIPSVPAPPSKGMAVFVTYIDEYRLKALSETLELPITVYNVNDTANLPPDVARASNQLSATTPLLVNPLSDNINGGYAVLNDLEGAPLLVIKIELPRAIYQQGVGTVTVFMLALLIVSLIILLVSGLVVDRLVLSRLAKLSVTVDTIKEGTKMRVDDVAGSDELSRLAEGINRMLGRLEDYQFTLQQNEARLRVVIANAPLLLWAVDEVGSDGRFMFLEGNALQSLRIDPSEIKNEPVSRIAPHIGIDDAQLKLALGGKDTSSSMVTSAGHRIDTFYKPVRDEITNNVLSVVGVGLDMSSLKRAESAEIQLKQTYSTMQSTLEKISAALKGEVKTDEIQKLVEMAQQEIGRLKVE